MAGMRGSAENEAEWAESAAKRLLAEDERRWRHTEGVAGRAADVARVLEDSERAMLVGAAFLHDVGYARSIAASGFHPLDGARWLRSVGQERLAGLVAYHSASREEAAEIGLARELAEFVDEDSLVSWALTYCDLTTGPDGSPMSLSERLDDVAGRRGQDDVAVRAMRTASGRLERIVSTIDDLLSRSVPVEESTR